MPLWEVKFFPPAGERLSPDDYIVELSDAEAANIALKLDTMCQLPKKQWSANWCKPMLGKILQLTVGAHRIMYCLDGRLIVVLHAFRKRSQKTKKSDIRRAKLHYDRYYQWKEQ